MNYWLFKTEPDDISLDDIRAAGSKGLRWDGIRNYQARNFLRDAVKKGDGVLIYHSQCKQVGVVGTARVISDSYADPAQFDPDSPYADPKATTDTPRWFCVDIAFDGALPACIPLSAIKQDPALAGMVLVKQGRLSVQPVTAREWRHLTRNLQR